MITETATCITIFSFGIFPRNSLYANGLTNLSDLPSVVLILTTFQSSSLQIRVGIKDTFIKALFI